MLFEFLFVSSDLTYPPVAFLAFVDLDVIFQHLHLLHCTVYGSINR